MQVVLSEFPMKAMILAAGRGERMRPLTDATPKPLLEAGARRLIEYHLLALAGQGIVEVVINVAWLGDQVRKYLEDGRRYGLQITYSQEEEGALETGGGIFQALPRLGSGPFWVINSDIRTDYSFAPPELAPDDLAHLVLVPNPDHHPAGDFALESGRVANSGNPMLTYSGIAVMRPELFEGQVAGRFPLAPLLRSAARSERLAGSAYPGVWLDVGTPERLEAAAKL